jgi:prepilin-type N-terminal cleavage/methylation domain-containing protein
MRIHASDERGFTLLEIMIVVCVIGLIIAIVTPNFLASREIVHKDICIENLTQIESAKQIWGVETGKGGKAPASETAIVGPLLYIKVAPKCPAGGTYDYGAIDQKVTCTVAGHEI